MPKKLPLSLGTMISFLPACETLDGAEGEDMASNGQLLFGEGVWKSAFRADPDE
jgi:hypothetical protein